MSPQFTRPFLGLVAGVALLAVPSISQAQFIGQPGAGLTIATPSFGLTIGNAPVVVGRPAFVPVAPVYPVYRPPFYGPRPYPVPYRHPGWSPYRGPYGPGPYGYPYRGPYGRPF